MANNIFERQFRVFVQQLDDDVPKQIAALARKGKQDIINENKARGGFAPGVWDAVDGVHGRPYEQVRPDGKISQLFDYRSEIIARLFVELRARSPIGPVAGGHYRDEFFCLLDGSRLGFMQVPSSGLLFNVNRITVTNPRPYSRKLEFGITEAGRSFVANVEPHIVENAMHAVAPTYRGLVKMRFATIHLGIGHVLQSGKGKGRAITYPAIHIDRLGL